MPNFPSVYLEVQEIWRRLNALYANVTNIESSIDAIDSRFNSLNVNFIASDGELPSVRAIVQGGIPPYTYSWSLQEGTRNTRKIISSTDTDSIIMINNLENNSMIVEDSTMLKLEVADSNNLKNVFYYNYSVVGYTPMNINIDREILTASCLNSDIYLATMPWVGLDFFDLYDSMDVYNAYSKHSDPNIPDDANSQFREIRDIVRKNVVRKITDIDIPNHYLTNKLTSLICSFLDIPDQIVNINTFNEVVNEQINQLLASRDNCLTYNKYTIRKVKLPVGGDLYKYEDTWNTPIPGCNNKTAYECIGNIPRNFLGEVEELPSLGQDGQYLLMNGYYYAWNPIKVDGAGWDESLGELIGDAIATISATRDAVFQAFNELSLANGSFLHAAFYIPLHKIK